MLTAEKARALDPSKLVKSDLEVLDKIVRAAAAKGKKVARVPYDLCEVNGYGAVFKRHMLEHHLTDLGYKYTVRSEERQFVDTWIEISWEDTDHE